MQIPYTIILYLTFCQMTFAGECGAEKLLVGYVVFYYIYSTFKGRACYIEDVYVTPAWRGKGIGRAMWTEVTKVMPEYLELEI